MAWSDLVLLFAAACAHLVLIPLLGAAFLLACFRVCGIPGLTFFQGWKAYLAAVCYGLIAIVALNFFLPWQQLGSLNLLAVQVCVTCLTHLVVVVLFLRKYSPRALLAQGIVVVLTNLVTITLMFSVAQG